MVLATKQKEMESVLGVYHKPIESQEIPIEEKRKEIH